MNKVFLFLLVTAGTYKSTAQGTSPAGFQRFSHTLFRDNFRKDTLDRFPSNWILCKGHVSEALFGKYEPDYGRRSESGIRVMEDEHGERFMAAPKSGDPCVVPILDSRACPDSFTLEFDCRITSDRGIADVIFNARGHDYLIFSSLDGDGDYEITVGDTRGIKFELHGKPRFIKGTYPGEFARNAWHHFAAEIRNHVVKLYIDQYKLATLTEITYNKFDFVISAENDQQCEVHYKNFLVTGGFCYPFNNILTENRFVTRAIQFDVNKSAIKPESLDIIDQMAAWLKQYPAIKLEIGGHTDSDGDSVANIKLSQARADEVKKQLVARGIKESLLTTKGYGATKPLMPNATEPGKTANRRVEFVKMSGIE